MKILEVHSGNAVCGDSTRYTFVREQGTALEKLGCVVDYYAIVGKGLFGYLKNVSILKKKISKYKPHIIHAHFGLCGMVAVLAAKQIPVVITFHNGETLNWKVNILCSFFAQFAKHVVYVAQHIYDKCYIKAKSYTILPCGVPLDQLPLTPYADARKQLEWSDDKKYILFGGAFGNLRKNYPILRDALTLLQRTDVEVVEMKGFSRAECVLRMCACDVFALPTHSEGSPQALKEAMACNCPIVATDVADIAHLLGDMKGHYLLRNPRPTKEKWVGDENSARELADLLQQALAFDGRTDGRKRIVEIGLTNDKVAKQIMSIYLKLSKIGEGK